MGYRNVLRFSQVKLSDSTKTKFGGQPDWIEEPQWPISHDLEEPMRFIAQIALGDVFPEPEYDGKMAYIFMTEEDGCDCVTFEPDCGENAVIIQPSGICAVETEPLVSGPSREEFGVEIIKTEVEEYGSNFSYVGGAPEFMQGDDHPRPKENWMFLAQLDSETLPFEINFAGGIAYVFINKSATEGRFLWQCG